MPGLGILVLVHVHTDYEVNTRYYYHESWDTCKFNTCTWYHIVSRRTACWRGTSYCELQEQQRDSKQAHHHLLCCCCFCSNTPIFFHSTYDTYINHTAVSHRVVSINLTIKLLTHELRVHQRLDLYSSFSCTVWRR